MSQLKTSLKDQWRVLQPIERNELIMVPVPKPKFFERKVPDGQSEDDYFDEITFRQTHLLRNAIDRVSLIYDKKMKTMLKSAHLSICYGSCWYSYVAISQNCF